MSHKTHPHRSDGPPFSSLPFSSTRTHRRSRFSSDGPDPSSLPCAAKQRIAAEPPQRPSTSTSAPRLRRSRFSTRDSLSSDGPDSSDPSSLPCAAKQRIAAEPPQRPNPRHRRSRFSSTSSDGPDSSDHSSLPCAAKQRPNPSSRRHRRSRFSSLATDGPDPADFSCLPYDVMRRIANPLSGAEIRSASLACRSWWEALAPMREAAALLKWGKVFKHGRGLVRSDRAKALASFLKGAALGYAPAMVDAGLMHWEDGEREEAMRLYRRAAELGDAAGQCNLGISCLLVEPPNRKEAVKWLYKASMAGHIRAQYQLALCLHQDRGVDHNPQQAARWFLKAAEGGYARAMYNTSLSYSYGEGLVKSHRQARKWMARAANRGHIKAQYEHGLSLFIEGDMMNAFLYLELASRAGQTSANQVRDIILEQLPLTSRSDIMLLVDEWRALPSR